MKKYLSSLLLIVVFTAYATYRRMSDFGPQTITNDPPPLIVRGGEDDEEGNIAVVPPSPLPVQPQPSSVPVQPQPTGNVAVGRYKNGTYTGSSADAYYGNVQVQVTVQNGNVADVRFLDHPKDNSTSVQINTQAIPSLVQEAIQAQAVPVDIVSGATETSLAFNQSFASALAQANN